MHNYMNQMMNKQQQQNLTPETIVAVKQHVFSFSLSEGKKQFATQSISKVRYKDSLPSSFGCLKQQIAWKPKIKCKRIYDDPKFLLSLERKKVRVINGIRQSQFEVTEPQKNHSKTPRIKPKKQPFLRSKVLPSSQKISQNYTHTSLNLTLNEGHRIARNPFLNFNLHHLIRERKHISEIEDCPGKKGSNAGYYTSFKNNHNKFQDNFEHLGQIQGDRYMQAKKSQIRTAKTKQRQRNKHSVSMHQNRISLQNEAQPKQLEINE